jgi:hypothetical protein
LTIFTLLTTLSCPFPLALVPLLFHQFPFDFHYRKFVRKEIHYNRINVGRNRKKRERGQEMGVEKTVPRIPFHLIVLYWRAGGIHVVKDNESEWLRWLLNQRRVILTHPKHRDNK